MRILGSMIEKRWTTPDQYPLSLNALVAACNQKSNRDPVLSLEEFEITGCLLGLREKGLVLIRERDGGRVKRYAEKLSEELTLDPLAAAVVTELMLRGPQTVPELFRRVKRMAPVESVSPVEESLVELARTRLVRLLARQPGRRHARWGHLLSAEEPDLTAEAEDVEDVAPAPAPTPEPTPEPTPVAPSPDLRAEVEALRREVAGIRERLDRLEHPLS